MPDLPDGRAESKNFAFRLLALCLLLAPALGAGLHVARNAVNTPAWDDWERGQLLEKYDAGALSFDDLNAPRNGRRILLPRLIALGLSAVFHGDLRAEVAFIFLSVCISSGCLCYLVFRMLPPGFWRIGTMLAVNMALFSPLQYQNFLWPAQLGFMLPFTCLCVCLATLRARLSPALKLMITGAAAAAGTYSFSHGLLLGPVIFFMALFGGTMEGRSRAWFLCGIAAITALLTYGYLGGESPGPSSLGGGAQQGEITMADANTGEDAGRIANRLEYFLASLGNPLARVFDTDPRESAAGVGLCLLLLFAGLGAWMGAGFREKRHREALLPWAAAGMYSLGAGAMLAAGRAAGGLGEVLQPHYSSLTLFLPIAILGAGGYMLLHWARELRAPSGEADGRPGPAAPARVSIAAAGVAVAIFIWWPGWIYGISKMEAWRFARLESKAALLYIDQFEPDKVARIDRSLVLPKKFAPYFDGKGLLSPPLIHDRTLGAFKTVERPLDKKHAAITAVRGSVGKLFLRGWATLPGVGSRAADGVLLTVRESSEAPWSVIALAEMRGAAVPRIAFLDSHYGDGPNLNLPDHYARWEKEIALDAGGPGVAELRAWALDVANMRLYPIGADMPLRAEAGGDRSP